MGKNRLKKGIIEKISYERRPYESVNDRSHVLLGYISKINGKQNSGTNELIKWKKYVFLSTFIKIKYFFQVKPIHQVMKFYVHNDYIYYTFKSYSLH